MRTIRFLMGATLSIALFACGPKDVIPSSPTHPATPGAGGDPAAIAAAEQSAYAQARPVFDKYCAPCHSTAGAKHTDESLEHFTIDAYPFGGHHATEAGAKVREVLGAAGGEATMPKDAPGSVQGAELEAVLAWSRAFDASHAAGLHHHGEGDHDHGGMDHGGMDHGGMDHDHGDSDPEHGGHH